MAEGKAGRPAHVPTPETRALVLEMVGAGRRLADIAAALDLSEPTVAAHYAGELGEENRPQQIFGFAEFPKTEKAKRDPAGLGRKPHVPTKATRERVEILLAGGLRKYQVAAVLGLSLPTLAEHYAAELAGGGLRKRAAVIEAQFTAAVGGNVAAQKAFLQIPQELEAPPGAAGEAAEPAPVAELGKKQQAQVDARLAEMGSGWEGILPN